jgi:hypothetical protein
MQLIATIDDLAVIQRIVADFGLPGARAGPPSPSPVLRLGPSRRLCLT